MIRFVFGEQISWQADLAALACKTVFHSVQSCNELCKMIQNGGRYGNIKLLQPVANLASACKMYVLLTKKR